MEAGQTPLVLYADGIGLGLRYVYCSSTLRLSPCPGTLRLLAAAAAAAAAESAGAYVTGAGVLERLQARGRRDWPRSIARHYSGGFEHAYGGVDAFFALPGKSSSNQ